MTSVLALSASKHSVPMTSDIPTSSGLGLSEDHIRDTDS